MIDWLTRFWAWVFRFWAGVFRWVRDATDRVLGFGDTKAIAIKVLMGGLALGLIIQFLSNLGDFRSASEALSKSTAPADFSQIPAVAPLIWQALGVLLVGIAFALSLCLREPTPETEDRRAKLIVWLFWIAAAGTLCFWIPADIAATQDAIQGKALAGENPSGAAYIGQLVVIASLILSIPLAAMLYFKLSLMDRYVVHSFLTPFSLCLFSFMAIWVIADITDNSDAFAGMSLSGVLRFYVVQVPFVIVFVMPIAVLLSGLAALSKLSKSNELISMIGAGRSVSRILIPIYVIGCFTSLICLAFKYEWAPTSVGFKEATMEAALNKVSADKAGREVTKELWAKKGWMHVNEVDRRTWFIGLIPLKLSDPMAYLIVWKMSPEGSPERIWKAERARWRSDTDPQRWELKNVQIYTYEENAAFPRVEKHKSLHIEDWTETPWKVLSSSQDPEFLGLPGLTMYLNAHSAKDRVSLAPFRTNWWYIFAEPLSCLALILVAAPLGIVFSRRASLAGVTWAIIIFAFMYLMRGTFVALGQRGDLHPAIAAWSTNVVVGLIGLFLLWFRARNREIPSLKKLFQKKPAKSLPA